MAKSTSSDAQVLIHSLRSAYSATPTNLKIIDLYVVFAVFTALIQIVYMAMVGSFPFNSFLSGVLSCVGTAVLAATGNSSSSLETSRNLPFHGLPESFQQLSHSLFFKNHVKPEVTELGVDNLDSTMTAVDVLVTSAVELDQKQIDKIARKMRRLIRTEDLRMEATVDPSLIAGLVIRYGDAEGSTKVIDLSVNGQLAELADRIEALEQEQSWNICH